MNDHPSEQMLRDYLELRLSESVSEEMLQHFMDCDDCLTAMDNLWAEIGLFNEDYLPTPDRHPVFDATHQVIRRIRRSNLIGEGVRFAFKGTLIVIRATLRSLAGVFGR